MRIDIDVSHNRFGTTGLAETTVRSADGNISAKLDLATGSLLRQLAHDRSNAIDFLLVSSLVYLIDKLVGRHGAQDCWTRHLVVEFPVYNPDQWNTISDQLQQCVSFLTGDQWEFGFRQLSSSLLRAPARRRYRSPRADAVCLFSGGLDSLVGAIDWLEEHSSSSLLLVGHHDGNVAGPLADQNRLFPLLEKNYPRRVAFLPIRAGQQGDAGETTFRSRSLLFLAIGACAAHFLTDNKYVIMPENGTIAVNVPLTPSRRGACSTRTAHPYYLRALGDVLNALGLGGPIINPLQFKTKGEVVEQCMNRELLSRTVAESVSCAKRGHKVNWTNRTARSCGWCMPCIYRRAALHKCGLDTEAYGIDLCAGGLDISSDGEMADDFRACAAFLRLNASRQDIEKLLLANGSLPVDDLPRHADVVFRAMEEVRALLRDKGTATVKGYVGL